MADTYYIGAYWGPRKESAEQCAHRVKALLEALASVDPLLTHWFKQARTRKEALQRPLATDLDTLQRYVQSNATRDDMRVRVEDLGFNLGLWNGGSGGEDVGLLLACGGYSPHVSNFCLSHLPSEGPSAERLLTPPVLTRWIRSLVLAWDPDWAVVTSSDHRELVTQKAAAGTFVGWLTYHSRRRGTVPPLPAPVSIEPVEGLGTLIVLTPERLTAHNPEHLAQATRVMELLERAGMLLPVRSPTTPATS